MTYRRRGLFHLLLVTFVLSRMLVIERHGACKVMEIDSKVGSSQIDKRSPDS